MGSQCSCWGFGDVVGGIEPFGGVRVGTRWEDNSWTCRQVAHSQDPCYIIKNVLGLGWWSPSKVVCPPMLPSIRHGKIPAANPNGTAPFR